MGRLFALNNQLQHPAMMNRKIFEKIQDVKNDF